MKNTSAHRMTNPVPTPKYRQRMVRALTRIAGVSTGGSRSLIGPCGGSGGSGSGIIAQGRELGGGAPLVDGGGRKVHAGADGFSGIGHEQGGAGV